MALSIVMVSSSTVTLNKWTPDVMKILFINFLAPVMCIRKRNDSDDLENVCQSRPNSYFSWTENDKITRYEKKYETGQSHHKIKQEWSVITEVINRILFLVYVIYFIVLLAEILEEY